MDQDSRSRQAEGRKPAWPTQQMSSAGWPGEAPHAPCLRWRSADPTIHVIDDDALVRESVRRLLARYDVQCFASAAAFLQCGRPQYGDCVITDIRMPQMSGIELQHALGARGLVLAVIVLTGHADVGLAVAAMKAGALDLLQKPFDSTALRSCAERALEYGRRWRRQQKQGQEARHRLAQLTQRERDVFHHLCEGHANKAIGHRLGISPRTVEIHRARLQDKLRASCLAELISIARAADEPLGGVDIGLPD